MKQRIADLNWQLMSRVLTECPLRQRYSLGLRLHNPAQYSQKLRPAIAELYGDQDQLKLLYSAANSPAATTLRPGDQLVSINAQPLDSSPKQAMAQISHLLDASPVEIELVRQGKVLNLQLEPQLICDYPVYLSTSDSINAWADGDDISLNAGLLRFTRDDAALAMIIAHELAHNTLRHIDKRLYNGTLGILLDIAISSSTGITSPGILGGLGANRYSQQFETEADIAALKMIHKAGFDIRNVASFWRRIGAEHPATIHMSQQRSHPTSAARYLTLQAEINRLLQQPE